jgi:lipoprotein-anchoring transpeptidase ErfK/SrfK
VPPFPASHGCIRITTTAMDRWYDRLPVGTPMLVYRS